MNAKIFYFSGTGNSLFISKEISRMIDDCVLVPIARTMNEKKVVINEETIGIIYPVYCQTIPGNVKKFVRKLEFKSNPYIFGVATNNGAPGRANEDLDRMLRKKGGRLDSGYTITMPGNSIIIADYTNPPDERNRRLAESKIRVKEVANSILNGTTGHIESDRSIKWLIKGKITSLAMHLYDVPGCFHTNSNCTGCGICAKICPQKNIRIDKTVKWGGECIGCLACFHWCPNRAVELDDYTKDKLRYHHPEIGISEMMTDPHDIL
jgi:ferredoxin